MNDAEKTEFQKRLYLTTTSKVASYKVAEVIAKHEKPFTNGMFVKEAFPSYAEVLFDDLPNKCTIIFRIKDMPVSPRTEERRNTNMSADVTEQQTVALKAANGFSVDLDESTDIKDNSRLAVVARYCSNGEAHEKLCCWQPMYGTTKKKIYLTPSPRILRKARLI